MPMFSSEQMRALWRYAVDCDFHALSSPPNNEALPTAILPLGAESSFLPFTPPPSAPCTPFGRAAPCVDHAGTRIAMAFGPNIHIYPIPAHPEHLDAPSLSEPLILRGHVEDITALRFVPGSNTRLVSSSDGAAVPRTGQALPPAGPEIILWDTEAPTVRQAISDEALDLASQEAISTALAVLSVRASGGEGGVGARRAAVPGLPISTEHRYTLAPEEEADLRDTIRTALRKADTTTLVLAQNKLAGRLVTSFQSGVFNHAGDKLAYLPGSRPASNGDVAWDICVRDIVSPSSLSTTLPPPTSLVLKGHRDTITWVGFSPDDTLLGSVSWNKTIRIWDAQTGDEKWCWRTANQNWTGEWSPDGTKFLGTCGDGTVYLWDVRTGEEVWRYAAGKSGRGKWNRCAAWFPPIFDESGEVDLSEGLIAIGGDADGRVLLLAPHRPDEGVEKQAIQERRLSTRLMDASSEIKRMASNFLAVTRVRFLPSLTGQEGDWGVRLAYSIAVESGVEVVDLTKGRKWRIGVRPEGEEGQSGGARDEVHWEYLRRTGQIMLVDKDGVRFYNLD